MLYKAAAIKEPRKEAHYTNKCKLVEFSAYEKCRVRCPGQLKPSVCPQT